MRRVLHFGWLLSRGAVLVVPSVVIAGWIFQLPSLIQIVPGWVPMQFSTALCVLCLALASSLGLSKNFSRRTLPFVFLPLILATLSFFQYPLEHPLGLEQTLLRAFISELSIESAQMAPNTSAAIVFLSLAFMLACRTGEKSLIVSGCLALLAVSLGLSALAGYLGDIQSVYGWGKSPAMAPHSALCISMLGALHAANIHVLFGNTLVRRRRWQVAAALSLGVGVSVMLWWLAASSEYARLRAVLNRAGTLRKTLIEHEFETDLERLRSVERLFASSQAVEEREFRSFTKNFLTPTSAISAIDWAPSVPAEKRPDFEQSITERHGQVLKALDDGFEPRRHPGAAIFFPVLYTAPDEYNATVLGLDHYSDPRRKAAMDDAAISGEARATPTLHASRLREKTNKREDFLVVVPAFSSDAEEKVDSVFDSRLNGFVIGVFRLSRLAASSFASLGPDGPAVEIFSLGEPHSEALLTLEQPMSSGADWIRSPMFSSLTSTEEITLAGLKFSIVFRPSRAFLDRHESAFPRSVLLSSLMFMLCLIGYLRSFYRKNDAIQVATDKAHAAVAEVMSYRAALDEHTIVAMTDRAGRIIEANNLFCKISGYSREELLNKTHSVVNSGYHPKSLFIELWKTISSGRIWRGEICNRAKDGRLYWLNTTIVPVLGSGGEPDRYIAVRSDITNMKAHQTELRVAKEAAESATQTKSEFLARMSHEIRTPLTAILGFSEQIVEGLDETERQGAAQIVLRNAKHLLGVVDHILDFSKIEAGHLSVNMESCDLGEMISDIESVFRKRAIQKGLAFIVECDPTLPRLIRTDSLRLRQILLNIVGNAIKFTDRGKITFSIGIVKPSQLIAFNIADTGIGIADEQMSRLFTEFSQADSSTTKRFGGTGLGLAISKRLALLLGGDIEAKSCPRIGSVFTLTIPCKVADAVLTDASEKSDCVWSREDDLSTSRYSVLVVEDGEDNQRLLTHLLKKHGLKVEIAENGKRAISKAIAGNFNLVLMDMHMPVMDGYTAIEQLRAVGYRVPIVACTADATEINIERLKLIGCDDIILKPFTADQFSQVVRRILPSAPEVAVAGQHDPSLEALRTEFILVLPQRMAEIRQAQSDGDYDQVARLAHKLAGAAIFGLAPISQITREIEQSARERNTKKTADLLDCIDAQYAEILAFREN